MNDELKMLIEMIRKAESVEQAIEEVNKYSESGWSLLIEEWGSMNVSEKTQFVTTVRRGQ